MMTHDERDMAVERFQREARTMASLRSPHTITVYDFGRRAMAICFYAMEILDGMDLYDLVDNYGQTATATSHCYSRSSRTEPGRSASTGFGAS